MNSTRKRLFGASIILFSAVLSACGGRSNEADTQANTSPLAGMQGTYAVACFGDLYNGPSGQSQQGTITIAAPADSGSTITVSVRLQSYVGSTNCADSTLVLDATAYGHLVSKDTTKNYADGSGNTVSARVATVTYERLTVSKGAFSGTLPAIGATTDIAYVLRGNELYLSQGGRGADGLGGSLSTRPAVKQ